VKHAWRLGRKLTKVDNYSPKHGQKSHSWNWTRRSEFLLQSLDE
jgi:hypothetical protein